jgi:hypothetical protein
MGLTHRKAVGGADAVCFRARLASRLFACCVRVLKAMEDVAGSGRWLVFGAESVRVSEGQMGGERGRLVVLPPLPGRGLL